MTPIQQFRARVEDFLDRTGMAHSRLGSLACNDRAFVGDLRDGREPRQGTVDKVDAFIRGYDAGRGDAVNASAAKGDGVEAGSSAAA